MHNATTLVKASWFAGLDMLRPPMSKPKRPAANDDRIDATPASSAPVPGEGMGSSELERAPGAAVEPHELAAIQAQMGGNAVAERADALIVPIRSLGAAHRGRIAAHLLSLDAQDRFFRFGHGASDEQIEAYANGLDFERDEVFGIYNRKLELVAVAHLANGEQSGCRNCAEFGVSVAASARGRGYGSQLFERAMLSSRNEGVNMLFMQALTENTAMLRIAQKYGARLVVEGSEAEAYLALPAASIESRVEEYVEEKIAQIDFDMKRQAKRFWSVLATVQDVRKGVIESLKGGPSI